MYFEHVAHLAAVPGTVGLTLSLLAALALVIARRHIQGRALWLSVAASMVIDASIRAYASFHLSRVAKQLAEGYPRELIPIAVAEIARGYSWLGLQTACGTICLVLTGAALAMGQRVQMPVGISK